MNPALGLVVATALAWAGWHAAAADVVSSTAARDTYAAAAALQNREAWGLAAEEWSALLRAHPQDPLAVKGRYYLAICLIKTDRWPDAERTLREVIASGADPEIVARARLELGRGLFRAAVAEPSPAAYAAAADALGEYLALPAANPPATNPPAGPPPADPQVAEAAFLAGEALWQAGRRPEAIAAWRAFVRDRPDAAQRADVLYALGVGLAETGAPQEAAEVLEQFATAHAGHPFALDAALWRADLATALGQPQAALDIASAAVAAAAAGEAAPFSSLSRGARSTITALELARADALWAVERPEAAAAAYAKVRAENPDAEPRFVWQFREGAALVAAGRWREAQEALAAAAAGLSGEPRAEALLLGATALVELGEPAAAGAAVERIVTEFPEWPRRPEVLLLAVRAADQAGDAPAALVAAERLVKEFPDGPNAAAVWYRLGQLRQAAGRFDEAIEAYESSVAKSSVGKSSVLKAGDSEARADAANADGDRVARALLAAGWCHDATGRLDRAIETWSRVIDTPPVEPTAMSALLARADARLRSGDAAGGLADAEQLLGDAPRLAAAVDRQAVAEARFIKGLCLVRLGRHLDAAGELQELLETTPDFAAADRALFETGQALLAADRPAEAAAAFERLVAGHPESDLAPDAWLELGELRWAASDWPGAATAYERSIATAGGRPGLAAIVEQARHKLGWTHVMRQDHPAAAAAFREQLATAADGPLAADAAALLGDALAAQGRLDEAAEAFTTALDDPARLTSDGVRALAFVRAAECAAAREQWAESLALAERFLDTAPESPRAAEARYAAAWARQNLGRLDEALAGYRQVADAGRTELAARARLMEGEVLFEQGDHKEAIKAFFKTAYGFGELAAPPAFHPWQAQATYEAARCFEVLGQTQQARTLYGELLERYPDFEHVPAARRRLEALGARSTAPSGTVP